MHTIIAPNVHVAFPFALAYLFDNGIERDSRNGPVLQSPMPVATVYTRPWERVLFYPERDANPFFHLYESLWMLQGRNDVQPLARYAKNILNFSNDGSQLHGAYGFRWRRSGKDQLEVIAKRLQARHEDRRSVLQMWDHTKDLWSGDSYKDVPCNVTATFQISENKRLDMVVFNRSNDIVWGCYGANAVHFSILQEFMASWIGVDIGTYTQVSVNWHGYRTTVDPLRLLINKGFYSVVDPPKDPYCDGIRALRLFGAGFGDLARETFELEMRHIMAWVDTGCPGQIPNVSPFLYHAGKLLEAHQVFRDTPGEPDRFDAALELISELPNDLDWVVACREWIQRRRDRWEAKQTTLANA